MSPLFWTFFDKTHFPALTAEWTHTLKSLFLLSVHSYIMCILMSADLKKCAVILSPRLNFEKLCSYFIGQLDLPSFTPIQNEVRSFKGDIHHHHHHHHTPETSYTPGAAALSRPRSCNRLIRNVSYLTLRRNDCWGKRNRPNATCCTVHLILNIIDPYVSWAPGLYHTCIYIHSQSLLKYVMVQ